MSEWISMKEACEILGIAHNTLRKLIRTGVLPAYEIKSIRGYQIKKSDVEALITLVKVKTKGNK